MKILALSNKIDLGKGIILSIEEILSMTVDKIISCADDDGMKF